MSKKDGKALFPTVGAALAGYVIVSDMFNSRADYYKRSRAINISIAVGLTGLTFLATQLIGRVYSLLAQRWGLPGLGFMKVIGIILILLAAIIGLVVDWAENLDHAEAFNHYLEFALVCLILYLLINQLKGMGMAGCLIMTGLLVLAYIVYRICIRRRKPKW